MPPSAVDGVSRCGGCVERIDGIAASGSAAGLTFVFPESTVLQINRLNMRNGLAGGTLSRAAAGCTQGGVFYAVDFIHGGTGANCVTWNTSFAGATRGQASLAAGTQTGATVAEAWMVAMTALGAVGLTRVANVVTVPNGSAKVVGAAMPTDHESLRGMWGAQRSDFGGAPSTATQQATMGNVIAVHTVTPSTAGRILGIYVLTSTGTADIRVGIADGPAYSTTPAQFTGGQEGIATADGSDDIRLLLFAEPIAFTASDDKWLVSRSFNTGNPTIGFRAFTDTPTGSGDLISGEQLLSNADGVDDPTVDIFGTAVGDGPGEYTAANEAGPFSVYSQIGYIYEIPVAGEYPADGGFEVLFGYHGAYNNGTPTTAGPAVLETITETFRMNIPWECSVVSLREALADNAADEDSGLAFYNWDAATLATVPTVADVPLLLDHGPMNASAGGGYKSATLVAPLPVQAGTVLGPVINHGNDDGVTPATTITTNYDPPGVAGAYLSGWGSQAETLQGREWSDLADSQTVSPLLTQYLTVTAGNMPVGDPDAVWPDPFDPAASDSLPQNNFRLGVRLTRAGIA